MPMYLIQGVSFPDEQTREMMRAAGCPDFVFAAMKELPETWESVFTGMIFPDPLSVTGNLIGRMRDHHGESVLYDVNITSLEVRFTKKYLESDKYDTVGYHLRRRGSLWVGDCRGLVVGAVKCVITLVPEGLFKPDSPSKKKARRRRR